MCARVIAEGGEALAFGHRSIAQASRFGFSLAQAWDGASP
jgi:hypothetical protein